MSAEGTNRPPGGRGHRGPPLLPVAIAHVGLFVAGVVVLAAATEGGYPRPNASFDQITDFFRDERTAVTAAGTLQAAAAVPLAIFAAAASSRLWYLGVRAAGAQIALTGGIAASVMLAISGLLTVAATDVAGSMTEGALVLLHRVVFLTGGVGAVIFYGLLSAGLAVPVLVMGVAPSIWGWVGLAAAAASELATVSLLVEQANLLIPVGRYAGMVFLIGVAATLPRTRRPTQQDS